MGNGPGRCPGLFEGMACREGTRGHFKAFLGRIMAQPQSHKTKVKRNPPIKKFQASGKRHSMRLLVCIFNQFHQDTPQSSRTLETRNGGEWAFSKKRRFGLLLSLSCSASETASPAFSFAPVCSTNKRRNSRLDSTIPFFWNPPCFVSSLIPCLLALTDCCFKKFPDAASFFL